MRKLWRSISMGFMYCLQICLLLFLIGMVVYYLCIAWFLHAFGAFIAMALISKFNFHQ